MSRKRSFCAELLEAYDVVAPGLSKERGLALYEIFTVDFFLLKKALAKLELSSTETEECLSQAKLCRDRLSESQICLKHERDGSFEHRVLDAGAKYLDECKELVEVLTLMARSSRQ